MGYFLEAFICKKQDTLLVTNRFKQAISVELDDHLSLIPMTEELFDEINELSSSPSIGDFQYMTENVEQKMLDTIRTQRFAYVEAEYFGSQGGQTAIIWNNNVRVQMLSSGEGRINTVLKDFGVIAHGETDEFTTVGLLRQRRTKDWVDGDNNID
jgi:hypothetical protein